MSDTELEPEVKAWFDSKGETTPEAKAEPAKEPVKTETKPADPVADKPAAEPEAVKPEAKAEEADEDDNDEDDGTPSPDGQPRKQRKVNWSAYSREKQQRKETEARLARIQQEYEEKMALINQRLSMMNTPPQPQKPQASEAPQPVAIPDPEEDIFAFAKYTAAELAAMKAKEQQQQQAAMIAQQRAQEQAMRQQQMVRYERAIIEEYNKWGSERAKVDPDFVDAYDHARSTRIRQLMRHGMDEAGAKQQATREEFELAARSLQENRDPTQLIVDYAKDLGWQPKAKQAAPDPKRLDTIAKAQDVHKTMTGTGSPGAGRSPEVNAEALAKMSNEEFAAFLDKAGDKGFRAAMTR